MRENFTLTSVTLLEQRDGEWTTVACAGEQPCAGPEDADDDVPVTAEVHLALRGRPVPAADRQVLEAAARQALLALRQQRMANDTVAARAHAETVNLRTALLSSLGHDLRTPLTSIEAAVSSLRASELDLSREDVQELLAIVEESADRLNGLVDNLLDSARITAGLVRPVLALVGYDEIIALALSGMDSSRIAVEVDERLPPVRADAGLLQRAVTNIVDYALRRADGDGHADSAEPVIEIRASAHDDKVELRVVDHGAGLPKDAVRKPFT